MKETHEITIEVRGMTCDHCERTVGKALKSVPGVAEDQGGRSVLPRRSTVTLFEQRAEITSGHSVRLANGRTITAGKILVTTGRWPRLAGRAPESRKLSGAFTTASLIHKATS